MAENGSWLRLYRKSLNSVVWSDINLWRVWSWCLIKANYTEGFFNTQKILPGQFVTGSFIAEQECGLPKTTIWRKLHKLEAYGCISLKTGNKFTIISLCNWETYNGTELDYGKQVGNKWETSGKQVGTIEEGKERKESKERKKHTMAGKPPCGERDYSAEFESFWGLYPKVGKVKKPDAWRAWKKAVSRADPQTIISAAADYASSDTGLSQFAGYAATWLNSDRWTEEPETWKRKDTQNGKQKIGAGQRFDPLFKAECEGF